MKSLNSVIWFLIVFLLITIIVAIVSKLYGQHLSVILVPINIISTVVIVEMMKASFRKDVEDYKNLYRKKICDIEDERKKLQEQRILLSKYIENKIKIRNKIKDSLNLEKPKE